MTLTIFDDEKNKKSGQTNKGQWNFGASRMSNAFASLKSQPKGQEEISKEFLPTNSQASRMSNAFVSLKSQPKNKQEIAKEFAPSKGQTFKHDNGVNLGNQKPK